MNNITLWIIKKIVLKAEPMLTGMAGRLIRKGVDTLNGMLLTGTLASLHLPGIPDGLTGDLIQYATSVILALISYGLSTAATHLAHTQGLAGTSSTDDACPKTKALLGIAPCLAALLILGAIAAQAQAVASAPVPSVASTGTSTNAPTGMLGAASLAALEKLDRTQNTFISNRFFNTSGVVVEGKENKVGARAGIGYNFSKDILTAVEITKDTGDTTVAALGGIAGYRIPIHNVEFDALAGVNYNWRQATEKRWDGFNGMLGVEVLYSVNEFLAPMIRLEMELNAHQPTIIGIAGFRVLIPNQ